MTGWVVNSELGGQGPRARRALAQSNLADLDVMVMMTLSPRVHIGRF